MDFTTKSFKIGGLKSYSNIENVVLDSSSIRKENLPGTSIGQYKREDELQFDNAKATETNIAPENYDSALRSYFGDFTVDWLLNIIEGGAPTKYGAAVVFVTGAMSDADSVNGINSFEKAASFFMEYTLKDKFPDISTDIIKNYAQTYLFEIPAKAPFIFASSSTSTLVSSAATTAFSNLALNAFGYSLVSTVLDYCDDGEVSWGTQIYKGAIVSVFEFAGVLFSAMPFIGKPLKYITKGFGFAVADATVGLYKTETGRAVGGVGAVAGAAVGVAVAVALANIWNPVGWAALAMMGAGCLVGAAVGVATTCAADNAGLFE